VDAVQIRAKTVDDRSVLGMTRRVRRALPQRTAVLVNGRFDVALAAVVQGVHLPASHVPVLALRTVAPDLRVGISTHDEREVAAAVRDGVDYVVFGPVFEPTSKRSPLAPRGLSALAAAVADCSLPMLALGGVDAARISEIAATGAAGIAGIGIFAGAQAARAVDEAHQLFPRVS
jgi:thiamine-phosphate diphosphorylase